MAYYNQYNNQEQAVQYQDEEYDGEEEVADGQEYAEGEEEADGQETYSYQGEEQDAEELQEGDEALQEGDEEVQEGDEEVQEGDELIGDPDNPYDEAGPDDPVAGEIVEARDEDGEVIDPNDPDTKAQLAAMFDPHNEDVPTDEEGEGKSHNFDITIRSANAAGDYFELKGKADSGADANFVCHDAVTAYNLEMIPEGADNKKTFKSGDGKQVSALGVVVLVFQAGQDEQKPYKERFHVVPGMNHDILLGTPFINASGVLKMKNKFKDTEEERAQKEAEMQDEPGDVDQMALQPPSKKDKERDASVTETAKKRQAEKRAARAAV